MVEGGYHVQAYNQRHQPTLDGLISKSRWERPGTRIMLAWFLCLLYLSACTAPTPTPTLVPTSQPTQEPIQTPTRTATPTTPSKTATAEPTATPEPTLTLEPLVLDSFDAKMHGVGTHGNMTCVDYLGDDSDLEVLRVDAYFSQDGTVIDRKVPLENIEGAGTCFEMVDAKYNTGSPVKMRIEIKNKLGISDIPLANIEQSYELGEYQWVPWMTYIYGESPLSLNHLVLPNPTHKEAYDLQPVHNKFPNGDGHPVTSPCIGKVVVSEVIPDSKDTNNMWIYCSQTGYFVQLGHMDRQVFYGDRVTTNTIVGYLHWEAIIGWPHNHTTVRRPMEWPLPRDLGWYETSVWVDMFNPHEQLGGVPQPYGFWLPDTLPQQVKNDIERGFFK